MANGHVVLPVEVMSLEIFVAGDDGYGNEYLEMQYGCRLEVKLKWMSS